MHNYLIGGLTLGTSINFPELIESNSKVDFTVEYGNIPEITGEVAIERVFMTIYQSDEVVFTIPELANYYIKGSEEVIIELINDNRQSDAEKYILTIVFGIISYKKGYYPLHGGGVVYKGKAILFTGRSGAGKSTTMVGLHERGFETIGDDISNLFFKDGKVYVHPCFPRFKLWDESMKILDKYGSGEYKLREDLDKYLIPMENFAREPIEVDRVYLLNDGKKDESYFEEFKGIDKVNRLKNNNYKPFMAIAFGLRQDHFQLLMKFSKSFKFFKFYRKKDKNQFEGMLDLLISHFDKQ